MPVSPYLGQGMEQGAPGYACFAVTAHDSNDFTNPARFLFVGTGGVVPVVNPDNTVVNWTVPDGSYIFTAARRVNSTNLTASAIVGII